MPGGIWLFAACSKVGIDLGLGDRGRLGPGACALLVAERHDSRELALESIGVQFGGALPGDRRADGHHAHGHEDGETSSIA